MSKCLGGAKELALDLGTALVEVKEEESPESHLWLIASIDLHNPMIIFG